LLKRLVDIDFLDVLPTGQIFKKMVNHKRTQSLLIPYVPYVVKKHRFGLARFTF